MTKHRWAGIPAEALNEAVSRQVLHTDTMTIARLRLRRGAVVPRHSHPNEQVSIVEAGLLRFIFDNETVDVRAGESMQIPGGAAHRVEALEDSVALDLFSPPREDWIRGDDAYLRGGSGTIDAPAGPMTNRD
jgi:quercetin dioxygenase-like cupin family protein